MARVGSGEGMLSRAVRREVFPNDIVVLVNFNGAGVAGVRQQGVAVGQTAGESAGAERPSGVERVDNGISASDFQGAIVVLVGNKDVAVVEQFGGVGAVELIGGIGVGSRVLPKDLAVEIDLDDPVVSLVSDEDVIIGQERGLNRSVQQVWPGAG
jgi:hypothetical protein